MAKPLKVRILKSTLNDGGVTYTAQYRMMGMWFSFAGDETSTCKEVARVFHDMVYDKDAPCPDAIWVRGYYHPTSEDIEGCKLLIKAYLDAVAKYNKSIADKTVKKTEVIRL